MFFFLSSSVSHHDVEVNVLAGLLSRQKGQVLHLHLAGVVQDSARVESPLSDGDVVFNCWRNKEKKLVTNGLI